MTSFKHNKEFISTGNTIKINEFDFIRIEEKCYENKSRSCFYKNFAPLSPLNAKYFMDNFGCIWTIDLRTKNSYYKILPEEKVEEKIVSKEYAIEKWEEFMNAIKGDCVPENIIQYMIEYTENNEYP
mgnify:CR=1 FL=1